jgi:RHS repeat-associated protein
MLDQKNENNATSGEVDGRRENTVNHGAQGDGASPFTAPSISLPKGGGAIRGIGEKFAANPVTGTGSMTVPLAVSPGRSGFGPQLALSYDSGAGNGPFGLGWNLSLPAITRKTDKGLPQYQDADESDVFILSGAEDLVPVLDDNGQIVDMERDGYRVRRYRPRIEGLFARIERWTRLGDGDIHWRSISKDNLLTIYGKDPESRVYDPLDQRRVFSWLICETRDDKGNGIVYEYAGENAANVDLSQANEANRGDAGGPLRGANRYIKRVRYGNRISLLDTAGKRPLFLTDELRDNAGWMFEAVFDYGDEPYIESPPDAEKRVFVQSTISASPGESWPARRDPFSTYRSGFEVRSYRLCRRTLMFHHFPDELGIDDCLVGSTEFAYDETPIASFFTSVTQSGYARQQNGSYLKKSLPPVEFEYSKAEIQDEIRELDADSLENLPAGLDEANYQWIDLDGDGVAGILTEQAGAWFYKRNLSPISTIPANGGARTVAKLAPVETVGAQPSFNGITSGVMRFLDLAGDGQPDLAQFDGPAPGFFEHTDENIWEPHRPFTSLPNVNWHDSNLKFVDLTGDGHADLLISEDEEGAWYPSLGEEGFGPSFRAGIEFDEEKGPRLLFADSSQSVLLADLSGDGLTDIVRIRNGEVCYWPNLGYGRFGAKVTMDGSPRFDEPDIFDQRRIHLADIDGSGVTDIIYLGNDGVHIYFNQSGNSWSDARKLNVFPTTDSLSSLVVVDLLGNGTACLVWSSPLPSYAQRPMYYVDLMGQKPHLLIKTANNLGAETVVQYAPSTKFYLRDKLDGKPWITRLPFPTHCVERVETYDRVSDNRFVSRYKYHHGYFDGVEREFRGFGMVEQWDTEEIGSVPDDQTSSTASNLDEASFVPPIHTKTWFHTGVFLDRNRVSNHFAGLMDAQDTGEYYREPGWSDADAKKFLLDDTVLPPGLTLDEEREACRALKGAMLRQEVYGLDGTDKAQHPYTVTEQNFTIKRLQPQGVNRHAVFFTHAREALSYHYERNPEDPRIGHALTLEVDKYGAALKSVAIGYGRKQSPLDEQFDRDKQTRTLITYTENGVTNAIDDDANPDDYRAPLPFETRAYELTGYMLANIAVRFQISDFAQPDPSDPDGRKQIHVFDSELKYEEPATTGRQRRLIEHARMLYRKSDFTGLLPLGQLESLALPGESYKLAFTPGLLAQVYKRKLGDGPEENLLPDSAQTLGARGADQGGYRNSQQMRGLSLFPTDAAHPLWTVSDADDHWWIPSGEVFFSAASDVSNPASTAAVELAEARLHFFLPRKFTDPFNHSSVVDYDAHDLLVIKTEDELQNTVTALHNYRALQPRLMTDPNGNRSEARFDALGMVVGTAVMGKAAGPIEGDSFGSFTADLTPQEIKDYFDAANPRPLAAAHLGTATTRILYDLERVPACAATIARETHVSDLGPGEQTKVQLSFVYSDGFGREAQTKIQAEPGPLHPNDPASPALNPRWVGSGAKVYNNKGKPVRQYEPFFSAAPHFGIEQHGVSSTLFYDPAERVVATLRPDHTWEKVVFDQWRQTTFDANDTVLNADGSTDPKLDNDVKGFFSRLPDADYLPTWYEQRIALASNDPERIAADKTAVHRQTPTVTHVDALGRAFLTVAHNRFERNNTIVEEKYPTRVELDIEGNQRSARDAVAQNGDSLGRIVMRYDYDMLGARLHQASMEAGERWMLGDVTGKPIRAWDSRGFTRRITHDELRRPTELFVMGNGAERLAERTVYGETHGVANNHRTRVYQVFDGAGVVTSEEYDFKGNLERSRRDLLPDYKGEVDWRQNPTPNDGTFTGGATFDALNRPTAVTAPDNSVYRPTYNEANLLDRVEANLRGAATATPFVTNIDYNAKGQCTLIHYANGAETTYEYDDQTFRLVHLKTTRNPGQNGQSSQIFKDAATVQDLSYTYDPAGNITHIEDAALLTIFHNGEQVEPVCDYTYDSLYRLIEAIGREHIGQTARDFNPQNRREYDFVGMADFVAHPNDLQAMRRYTERYEYDAVGNFQTMRHIANDGSWTRGYEYNENSLIEPAKQNNRLTRTTVGNGFNHIEMYNYTDAQGSDAHGCMTSINNMKLEWDFKDQLQQVDLGGGGKAYYVYDSTGQRARKVIEGQNGAPSEERLYIGAFELYRKFNGNTLVRETLHIMDDKRRIALVETKTHESGAQIPNPQPLIRYQLSNHLGSASVELDKDGALIFYEEYHPYGTAAFQAMNSAAADVSLKRYRYTGKERDEESGLSYHGARFCSPWLGRWISADPSGLADGPNLYRYARNSPLVLVDNDGRDPALPNDKRTVEERNKSYSLSAEDEATARNAVASAEASKELWHGMVKPQLESGKVISPPEHEHPMVSGISNVVGGTLGVLGGAAMVGGGAATSEFGVGIPVALVGVGAISGGATMIGVGLTQIFGGATGDVTPQQSAELDEATHFATSLATPTGQVFALSAVAKGGKAEDVQRYAEGGAKLEALYQFGKGGIELALRLDPELATAAKEGALFSRITPGELVERGGRPLSSLEGQAAQSAIKVLKSGGTTSEAGTVFHEAAGLAGPGQGADKVIGGAVIEYKTHYGPVFQLHIESAEQQTLRYSLKQQAESGTVPIRITHQIYIDPSSGKSVKFTY